MTTQTLRYIKKEIRKLCKTVETVNKCFDRDVDTLIGVLLHNAMFENPRHDHEESVSKLRDIQNALLAIAEYTNSYYEKWIAAEVDMIIQSNEMCEDYEESNIRLPDEDLFGGSPFEDQYPKSTKVPTDHLKYVGDKLQAMGHNDAFVNYELYIMQKYPNKTNELTDDTCAILSSEEYIANFGSWQL